MEYCFGITELCLETLFYFGGYKFLQMCICSYKTTSLNLQCGFGHDGIKIGSRQDFNFYYGFKRDEIKRLTYTYFIYIHIFVYLLKDCGRSPIRKEVDEWFLRV